MGSTPKNTLEVIAQPLTNEGVFSGSLNCLRVTKNGTIYVVNKVTKRKKT